MGDIGQNIAGEIALLLQSIQKQDAYTMAASTMVVYDYIMTFGQEVQSIWGRPLTSVTLLFYLNRWLIFIWAIYTPLGLFVPNTTLPVCMGLDYSQSVLSIALVIVWGVFSTIRVFAISGGNWALSSMVCALSLVPVATNIYIHFAISWFEISTVPFFGTICVTGYTFSENAEIGFLLGTRICAILADILILGITWRRTFRLKCEALRRNVEAPLATMLLKDGTVYFLGLLALNAVQIAGWITNDFTTVAQYFTTPLTSIITSHFLMDLRSLSSAPPANAVGLSAGSGTVSQASTMRFASFVGNMGGALHGEREPGERSDGATMGVGGTEQERACWADADVRASGSGSEVESTDGVRHGGLSQAGSARVGGSESAVCCSDL